MPAVFPPTSLFPDAIDSDYTLYLVYNTSESYLTEDNQPWSEEILIHPRKSNQDEVWSDNGFANIGGELFYYDSVSKNSNGKVYKFKGCVRNLGGDPTKFNIKNTDVRGFVIAEHHNQLVDAIINIEKFIGTVNCDDTDTLVCCLGELNDLGCPDDGNCPQVNFSYDVLETSDCEGTLISYNLDISGDFNNFRLDFGDGTFTTTTGAGEKRYAPNTRIDPVVSIGNEMCDVTITGINRVYDDQPQPILLDDPFTFPIPQFTIPDLAITPIEIPEIDISIPPYVAPCFEFPAFGISSFNIDVDLHDISLIVPEIPNISLIVPEIPNISLIVPEIPNISVIDDIPDIISVVDNIPTIISIVGITDGTISVDWGTPPSVLIDWGTPPPVPVNISFTCEGGAGMAMNAANKVVEPIIDEVDNLLWQDNDLNDMPFGNIQANIQATQESLGIPSEIVIVPPEFPTIKFERFPEEIKVNVPKIPDINIVGTKDIPSEIRIIAPDSFPIIGFDISSIPESIKFDWGDNPRTLSVDMPKLIIEHDIPSIIRVEELKVTGIPDEIRVTGFPDSIKVDPIEVIVKLDSLISNGADGEGQKYYIIPAGK